MVRDRQYIDRRVLPAGWLQWARNLLISVGIGSVVGLILWLPQQDQPLLLTMALSSWVGICIYLTCIFSLALAAPVLDFEGGVKLWLPLVLLFFVSGGLGFYLAARSIEWLSLGRIDIDTPGWSEGFAFAGVLGIVGGAFFFTYERMKGRLQESMERLKEQELAEHELETARKIQRRILPPATFESEGFRLAARNLPARVVAGDFYDVLPRPDGTVGVVVADVVGKGMGASLIMAGVKARLGYVASGRTVAETMNELNRTLLEELGEREFVALVYVLLDPASGRFELANAGLPDAYVLSTGEWHTFTVTGPRLPLGVRSDVTYESVEGRLQEGESLLLLTDGVPESLTPAGEPLGYPMLEEMLRSTDGAAAPTERLDDLIRRLEQRTSANREDDWTLVLLDRGGSAL